MDISKRKKDHVDLTVSGAVNYVKSAGFERYDFVHNALPEIDFNSVSTKAVFLNREFAFPLFISSMTGGYTKAGAVNAMIAEFCEFRNIPFGVGSQRIILEDSSSSYTFSIVREKAPTAFIASNIGGCQLINGLSVDDLRKITDCIQADAVIVHLNVLQELMQPEGDRNFKGIIKGIERLVHDTNLPVIVKETGAGITLSVAQKLINCGVRVIDISGAGGTSWSKVENERDLQNNGKNIFNEWGNPTVDCLLEFAAHDKDNIEIISSGGIRTAFDMIKSLCLGADFTATAQPVIKTAVENGIEGLQKLFDEWDYQFKVAMCLLGVDTIDQLNASHLRKV